MLVEDTALVLGLVELGVLFGREDFSLGYASLRDTLGSASPRLVI